MRTLAASLVPLAAAALLAGCGQADPASDPAVATSASTPTDDRGDGGTDDGGDGGGGECTYTRTADAARKVDLPPSEPAPAETLTITTNRGPVTVTLNGSAAPCTAGSFTSLARQGYFDDTRCHRLTTEGIFVLQCGDPTGTGAGGPGYSFGDEVTGDETYPAGTLAMANAGPDTNGSQFFVVYADTSLPPSYTVFGTVDQAGRQVVEKVAEAGTADGGSDGAPEQKVVIESVR
ncbi:MAG: peptidylprolyl isomerase [Nocardioidaceae bacterium]